MVTNNKGSEKEPSFALKATIALIFLFFFFNLFNLFQKDNSLLANHGINNDFFLNSPLIIEESSEFVIFNKNTVYASSPLYFPETIQVLGIKNEEENQCKKGITSYKVKEGENLSLIASKFEISIETITLANNLKNNKIEPEQDLVILPVSGIFHMTKSQETISSIAEKYEVKEESIVFCNEIDETIIGDILIIPGGKIPRETVTSKKPITNNITSNNAPSFSGSSWLIPPSSGYISQRLHSYNAVDIANSCNTTPIYASASGVIQQTGYHNIAGHYIRILHLNGVVTFYGHLSRILVNNGTKVNQGDVIAYMGNSGYTIGPTGCHVHFEVRGGTNPFSRYSLNHRF